MHLIPVSYRDDVGMGFFRQSAPRINAMPEQENDDASTGAEESVLEEIFHVDHRARTLAHVQLAHFLPRGAKVIAEVDGLQAAGVEPAEHLTRFLLEAAQARGVDDGSFASFVADNGNNVLRSIHRLHAPRCP